MTLKDKMQTAVDALLNESNGSTETSKIVEVCAEVAESVVLGYSEWCNVGMFYIGKNGAIYNRHSVKIADNENELLCAYIESINKKG